MLVTFVVGDRFAVKPPHAHLSELQIPLQQREILLLVDIPFHRVREIEHLISGRLTVSSQGDRSLVPLTPPRK
jgi:hypothetical protein